MDDLVNQDPNGVTTLGGIEFAIADVDPNELDEFPDFGVYQIGGTRRSVGNARALYVDPHAVGHAREFGELKVRRLGDVRPPRDGVTLVHDPRPRGLALKELRLVNANPWIVEKLYNRVLGKKATAKLYYVAVAIDGSGRPPFIWPLDAQTAADAAKTIKEGESYKWTLGSGAPIYGPRVIQGGVAISITVAESKSSVRKLGEALSTMTGAFKDNSDLMRLISTLAGPAGFAHELALEASARALGVVGEVLKRTPDKTFGAYAGVFSASGSWRGKLQAEDRGTEVKLVEILE